MEAYLTFQQTRTADDYCCDWHIKGYFVLSTLIIVSPKKRVLVTFCNCILSVMRTFCLSVFECLLLEQSDLGPHCLPWRLI